MIQVNSGDSRRVTGRKLFHEELLARQKRISGRQRLPFSVVLNNIRSLHNVGSIFRTCDGAGVEKIWLCGITGYPPDGRLAKTALGAQEHVAWEYRRDVLSVIRQEKERGYKIVLLEQTTHSIPHEEFCPEGPVCLVVGNEIEGAAEDVVSCCDAAVEIEMAGVKNSLNAAVAFGVVAYHIRSCLKIIFFLPLGMTLFLASVGFAGDEPAAGASLKSRHVYSSDIEATSGKVSVTETEFDYTYEFKADSGLPVEVSLGVGHRDITEDDPVDLPSHLESRNLGLSTKFPAPFLDDEHFFIGVDVFPMLNTDAWDWESGAFRIPFRGYLIYKESDDFILVVGISIRPEYDREVLPVLGLIYKPNERLSFNLASDDPHISYQLNDAVKLLWEFDYAFEEFEVTRAGQGGVVLKYQEASSGLGIQRQFNDNLEGHVSVGAVFNRRLEYRDDLGKVAPEAGFYAGAGLSASF